MSLDTSYCHLIANVKFYIPFLVSWKTMKMKSWIVILSWKAILGRASIATATMFDRHVYECTAFVFQICNDYHKHIQITRFSLHTGFLNNLSTVYVDIEYEAAIRTMCSTIMIHIFFPHTWIRTRGHIVGDWLKCRLVIGRLNDVIKLVGKTIIRGLWGVAVPNFQELEYLYVVYYSISDQHRYI